MSNPYGSQTPGPMQSPAVPQAGQNVATATVVAPAGSRGRGLGTVILLLGLAFASVFGLGVGYYVLCCVAPERFNFLGLPIPAMFQSSEPTEETPSETPAEENPPAPAETKPAEPKKPPLKNPFEEEKE
jgi:hypothetical protein